MQEIISSARWNTSPTAYCTAAYERRRNGVNMEYRFSYDVWLKYSSSYYYNALDLDFVFDGKHKYKRNIKGYNANETTWEYSGVTDWYSVPNKVDGTTSASITIYDASADKQKFTWNVSLVVDDAPSAFSSLNDFDVDGSFVVGISKYGATADKLTIKLFGATIRTINNIGASTTITFTEAERNTIYNLMKSVVRAYFAFEIESTYAGAVIGTTTKNAYGSITNANPIIDANAVRVQDANVSVIEITGNAQTIVQKLSSILVFVPTATAQKGAEITEYKIVFDGYSQTLTESGYVELGATEKEGELLLCITATDSRGNATTHQKKITITPYAPPILTASASRKNNYEDETHLKVNAKCAEIGANQATVYCEQKEIGLDDYGEAFEITNNADNILYCDKTSAYTFRITATDAFGSSVTQEITLAKGEFPLFIDTGRNAVGINAFPNKGEALRVGGGVAMFENGIVIQSSTEGSTKRFLLSVGDNGALTITEYKN